MTPADAVLVGNGTQAGCPNCGTVFVRFEPVVWRDLQGDGPEAEPIVKSFKARVSPGYINVGRRHPGTDKPWYRLGSNLSRPTGRVRFPAVFTCLCSAEVLVDKSALYVEMDLYSRPASSYSYDPDGRGRSTLHELVQRVRRASIDGTSQ